MSQVYIGGKPYDPNQLILYRPEVRLKNGNDTDVENQPLITYEEVGRDPFSYSGYFHALHQTSDNGFILAGWTRSFGPGYSSGWFIKVCGPERDE